MPRRQADTLDRNPSRPHLSHLFIWLSCCAVYFGMARQFLPNPPTTTGQFAVLTLLALYTGLCWLGTSLVIADAMGRRQHIEPGGWFLFSFGCILALDLAVGMLPTATVVRPEALRVGGACLAMAIPTLSRRLPGHWKTVFIVWVLLAAGRLVWLLVAVGWQLSISESSLRHFGLLTSLVGLLSLAAAIVRDRHLGRVHGWLHWTGILCATIWCLRVR